MIPLLRLLNLDLETVALIDDYESLYYEEKYSDIGTCSLVMPTSSENFKYLNKDMILYLDMFNCWYIEEISIDEDIATITALNLAFIFSHRVTVPLKGDTHLACKKMLSGDVIKYLIDKTLISSTDKNRNIPLKIINSENIGHIINFESRYKNLLSEIQSICSYSAIGFRMGIDLKNQDYLLEIYNGRDLSLEMVFSEYYDNLEDIKIVDSNSDYKNLVYIAGQGQGIDRKILTLGDSNKKGWLRREEIKDARDKELEEDLVLEGETFLSEKSIKTSIEIVIVNNEEVEIGDIVTVLTSKYGYKFTQRIVEKNVEYTTENGKVVGVIIGNPKPSLIFNKDENSEIE